MTNIQMTPLFVQQDSGFAIQGHGIAVSPLDGEVGLSGNVGGVRFDRLRKVNPLKGRLKH